MADPKTDKDKVAIPDTPPVNQVTDHRIPEADAVQKKDRKEN